MVEDRFTDHSNSLKFSFFGFWKSYGTFKFTFKITDVAPKITVRVRVCEFTTKNLQWSPRIHRNKWKKRVSSTTMLFKLQCGYKFDYHRLFDLFIFLILEYPFQQTYSSRCDVEEGSVCHTSPCPFLKQLLFSKFLEKWSWRSGVQHSLETRQSYNYRCTVGLTCISHNSNYKVREKLYILFHILCR